MNDLAYLTDQDVKLDDIRRLAQELGYSTFDQPDGDLYIEFEQEGNHSLGSRWSSDRQVLIDDFMIPLLEKTGIDPIVELGVGFNTLYGIYHDYRKMSHIISFLDHLLRRYGGCIQVDVSRYRLFTLSDLKDIVMLYENWKPEA